MASLPSAWQEHLGYSDLRALARGCCAKADTHSKRPAAEHSDLPALAEQRVEQDQRLRVTFVAVHPLRLQRLKVQIESETVL